MSELFTSRTEYNSQMSSASVAEAANLEESVATMLGLVLIPVAAIVAGMATLTRERQGELENLTATISREKNKAKAGTDTHAVVPQGHSHTSDQSGRMSPSLLRQLIEVTARLEALEVSPLMKSAVLAEGGTRLQDAAATITALRPYLQSGKAVLSPEAERRFQEAATVLHKSVHAGTERLFAAETTVLYSAITATFDEMGYRKLENLHAENKGNVIKAERGDGKAAFFVRLDVRGGKVEVDMSGFTGGSCRAEREKFMTGLARRGVELRVVSMQRHGDPSGGTIVRSARPITPQEAHARRVNLMSHHQNLKGR